MKIPSLFGYLSVGSTRIIYLTPVCISLLLLLVICTSARELFAEDPTAIDGTVASAPPPGTWQAKSRSPHQTEWFIRRYLTNSSNGRVRAITNSFVELCVNLNVPDAQGNYVPASADFTLTEQGAEANSAAHKVLIRPDIAAPDAIQVQKDGLVLKSHPLCIGFFDPLDGRSYLLADITNSIAVLTSPSEIVFSNCF